MPEPLTAAPLEEMVQLADEALQLVGQGRYEELLLHAEALEGRIEALEGLRSSLAGGGADPGGIAESCRRLQRRLNLLFEVLRHNAMVHYALREIETSFTSGYSAGGQLEPSAETHWSAEA